VTLDVPRISNTWVSFPGHFDMRAIFDNEISISSSDMSFITTLYLRKVTSVTS